MLFANLHNHSTFSDGVYTPEQLADLAVKQGHKAIALTDHETAQGTYFMKKAARLRGLYCLTGTELEGEGFDGKMHHIVGLDFNTEDKALKEIFDICVYKKRKRTQLLLEWALEKGEISGITWQEVLDENPHNDYICNNHVWRLLRKKGLWDEFKYFEFFKSFSRKDVEREARAAAIINTPAPDIERVISAIVKAGGIAIWAHPEKDSLGHIDDMRKMGLMGVEVNHPDVSPETSSQLIDYANEFNMYKSGGTDHSGVLGGLISQDSNKAVADNVGGIDEQEFMDLYYRRKG